MARTQFTFTFTNAQPGSVVSFSDAVLDHLYAAATGSTRLGRPLILNSSNALSVWSDVETLTATTEDGDGVDISATATRANPSVTTDAGSAGQNPFGSGGSSAWTAHVVGTTAADWTTTGGTWTFVGGVVSQTDNAVSSAQAVTVAPYPGTTFIVEADVRLPTGQGVAIFPDIRVMALADATTVTEWGTGWALAAQTAGDDGPVDVTVCGNGGPIAATGTAPTIAVDGTWHTVRAVCDTTTQAVYLDGAYAFQGVTGSPVTSSAPPVFFGIFAGGKVDLRNLKVSTLTLPA